MYKKFITTAVFITALMSHSFAGNIDSLENKLRNCGNTERISLLCELSALYRTNNPSKSLQYGQLALKLSKELNDPAAECRSLRAIGVAYSYLSRYEDAGKYFEESLNIAKENDLKDQLALSYNSLGNYNYFTGNLDKAIEYYEDAYRSAKALGSKAELPSYLSNIGIIYNNRGDYQKALEKYFESLEISEALSDSEGVCRAFTNIGAVYNDSKDFQRALEYYNKALDITYSTNDLHSRSNIYNNLGNIYSEQDKLNEALEFHLQSLKMKEKIGDEFGTAISLSDIGRIYASLGKYELAANYLKRSNKIQKKVGNTEGEIISLVQLGRTFGDMKKYDEALASFSQAVARSQSFSAKLLLDAYKGRSEVYENTGDYKNAYKDYILYSDLKDSLFNEKSSEQIAELQTNYESAKKDKEIALLQREKDVRELELAKGELLQNALIAGLAVIIFAAFLIYSRYRVKKNINRVLQEKISLINEQTNELKRLNANKDKLFSIISHDLRSPFQALLGYSELLLYNINELSREEIADYASNLNYTSQQTLMFFENLLEWAKLQTGKLRCKPEVFELAPAASEAAALLKHNAVKKDISLNMEIPAGTAVYADENMISSVLRNLISNAIKFSDKNGAISVRTVKRDNNIDVIVEDNGIGISQENIEKLLKGDGEISTDGTSDEKGSGLGLEICKEMIHLNNGSLRIESEPEKGSSFIFTLPASERHS